MDATETQATTFLEESYRDLTTIVFAIQKEDVETVTGAAEHLASHSRQIGAEPLARAAGELIAVAVSLPMAAQTTRPFLTAGPSPGVPPGHDQTAPLQCRGAISQITDIGFEAVKTSGFNWSNPVGGGEGKRFDPTPVLTTRV